MAEDDMCLKLAWEKAAEYRKLWEDIYVGTYLLEAAKQKAVLLVCSLKTICSLNQMGMVLGSLITLLPGSAAVLFLV